MSFSYNRVMLAGNLTRDPEVKSLANETAVANFGIAMNRKFKDKEGQLKEEVTFADVEAWGKTAELVGQYLVKGKGCFIEGRLKLDTWDDKDTGAKRSRLKIVADSVQFTSPASRPDAGNEDIAVSAAHSPPPPAAAPAARRATSTAARHNEEPPF